MCICESLHIYLCVTHNIHIPHECWVGGQKRASDLWIWSDKRLLTSWGGCWTLHEQHMLIIAEPSLWP